MSQSTITFGHPCEHQLRRTCIGGCSCPLNGYPDTWCCSFVKGKINFKRDKPCEGPRCRWGFVHPTSQQFDLVTQVLAEGRVIGSTLDEAAAAAATSGTAATDIVSFTVDNAQIVDTALCALQMMRTPASHCARYVGQLLAFAALKCQDAKVFTQLLKTMKKPIDSYLLGGYEFLLSLHPVGATAAAPGGKGARRQTGKKDDVSEELRSDMVDVMGSALSQNGQLVDRDDQRHLQGVFIGALRTYPKNKKRAELLEIAVAKFGPNPVQLVIIPPQAPPTATAVSPATVTTTAPGPTGAPPPPPPPPEAVAPPAAKPQGTVRPEPPRPAEEVDIMPPLPVSASSPQQQQPRAPTAGTRREAPATVKRTIGMSRFAQNLPPPSNLPRPYQPILPAPMPDVGIAGGLFGLKSGAGRLCGSASRHATAVAPGSAADLERIAAAALGITTNGSTSNSGAFPQLFAPAHAASGVDRRLLEGAARAWGTA